MTKDTVTEMGSDMGYRIDKENDKYPFCLVWTPIPMLTWFIPFIGHMGIALSSGVIRDFAGPYHVSEDNFAFGRPTKYLMLDPDKSKNGISGWDAGVQEASGIYQQRMHNLCCDNCHSHVATALNLMEYNDTQWNMIKVWIMFAWKCRYVNCCGFIKTWLPFLIMFTVIFLLCVGFY